MLVPEVMPMEAYTARGTPPDRICRYPGIKEDLYIHDLQPDPSFLRELKIDPDRILVLVRPPATMAHYAVRQSETIFYQALEYLCGLDNVQVLLLPRTGRQRQELEALGFKSGCANLVIPDAVYNGPSLIWYSDIVISGGGTMNREAATLGVPVYSIYQGPMGAVDRYLTKTGRLYHIKDIGELRSIPLIKFSRPPRTNNQKRSVQVRDFIVARILETAQRKKGAKRE